MTTTARTHAPPPTPLELTAQPPLDSALQRALDQNVAAADTVQQSADELLVISAVLKNEIPDEAQTGELAQALQHTDALEVKIQDTAQDLAQVNEVLSQEIAERGALEQELADTQAALLEAQASPPAR